MTQFIKEQLMIFFIENKAEAEKITNQILINKRSRESAEKARLSIKKKLSGAMDITNRVQKFVDCRSKDIDQENFILLRATRLWDPAKWEGTQNSRQSYL
jgi:DNA gyrase subunit B